MITSPPTEQDPDGIDYDQIHVVPIYSRRDHDLSPDCWCHPDPDPECPDLYVHYVEQ